jgi:diguanylate cyclase (GGDEF)-like protein
VPLHLTKLFQITTTRHQLYFTIVVVLFCTIAINITSYFLVPYDIFLENRIVANVQTVTLSVIISWLSTHQFRKITVLQSELRHALNHDLLTGAGTRSNMNEFLKDGGNFPCPIILVDIDYFKLVNDQHGHQAGDSILVQFVNVLKTRTRASDLLVRLGGEEFLILLPMTQPDETQNIANRICQDIATHPFQFDGETIKLTASFGVGSLTTPTTVDRGIQQVDKALYQAKSNGRNQVCLAYSQTDKIT